MSTREELLDLYNRSGKLTPEQIVDVAADPSSPLHALFEWDDAVAAHGYRIEQANQLIRRFRIDVEVAPERIVRVRQFMHVPSRSSYVPAEEAIAQHRDEVFGEAVTQLAALRAKYEGLVDVEAAWTTARRKARRKTGAKA